MNCDEAFDRLTDPSRRECPQLRTHLADCPRCRQMRDVLEPALDLFDVQPALDQSTLEPETADHDRSPFLSTEAVHLAQRTAADLSAAATAALPSSRRSRWVAVSKYAAVFLVGVVSAMAFAFVPKGEARPRPAEPTSPVASPCVWKNAPRRDGTVRAPQLVKSCVACHIQEGNQRFLMPLDELQQLEDERFQDLDSLDSTESAHNSRRVPATSRSLGEFEWHVCGGEAIRLQRSRARSSWATLTS